MFMIQNRFWSEKIAREATKEVLWKHLRYMHMVFNYMKRHVLVKRISEYIRLCLLRNMRSNTSLHVKAIKREARDKECV